MVVSSKQKSKRILPIRANRRLFLTGTPILKRPKDLWPICEAFDPDGLGRSWKSFVYRYCGAHETGFGLDINGATNTDELRTLLRQRFMVRRRKKEVLKELPDKTRSIVPLPAKGLSKQIDRELNAVRRHLHDYEVKLGLVQREEEYDFDEVMSVFWDSWIGPDGQFDATAASLINTTSLDFSEIAEARKELAIAKLPMVREYVEHLLEADEKVIVFCHHTEVATRLGEAFEGALVVTGKVPAKKRQAMVDRFQDDPDCRIIIGNMDAMGVGFTLTAARHVVFAELAYNPAIMEQAEDRAWRIGQKNAVFIHYLVVDGSLDARTIEILIEKQEIISAALDGGDWDQVINTFLSLHSEDDGLREKP